MSTPTQTQEHEAKHAYGPAFEYSRAPGMDPMLALRSAEPLVYMVHTLECDLAYVGITRGRFRDRWAAHLHSSWWLGEVTVSDIHLLFYESERAARLTEAAVINTRHPCYNTAQEPGAYRQWQADSTVARGNPLRQARVSIEALASAFPAAYPSEHVAAVQRAYA